MSARGRGVQRKGQRSRPTNEPSPSPNTSSSSSSSARTGRGTAAGPTTSRSPPTEMSREEEAEMENTFFIEGEETTTIGDIPLSERRDFSELEVKETFKKFICTFHKIEGNGAQQQQGVSAIFEEDSSNDPTQNAIYLRKMKTLFEAHQAIESSVCSFPVDLEHVRVFSPLLLRAVLHHPADTLVFMDETLIDLVIQEYASFGVTSEKIQKSRFGFRTAVYNHPFRCKMRDLDPQDIETLVSVRTVIIRCSAIIPDMRLAVFRCMSQTVPGVSANQYGLAGGTTVSSSGVEICGHEETVPIMAGEVEEPLICHRCQAKYSFELFHTKCLFGSKQLLKAQETPESIPEGETPHTILAYLYDDMVDACKPGDFVDLVGVFRASGLRVIPRAQTLKTVFRTFIDVNSVGKDTANRLTMSKDELERGPGHRMGGEDEDLSLNERARGFNGAVTDTAEDDDAEDDEVDPETGDALFTPALVEKMKRIGANPNVYQILASSLAPNIWEAEDVKRGLLCQLFGGTSKMIGDRLSRNDIHILLCGDPSTAKSQLLKYVHSLTARGAYACGRGSSAVGLTASMVRDPETREFVLESGAIVLSDKGICCIDEFDKMDDSARTILHEVMEQQTISIAKAGIVCSLNARAAILASANPVGSRYDASRSVVDNINLPASLMSRFDLIFLMLDCASEKLDRSLARHLCGLFAENREEMKVNPPLDRKTLSQYIFYARKHCHPTLSREAQERLISAYCALRRCCFDSAFPGESGGGGDGGDAAGNRVAATPRQLESLVRLSEALAKMQLSEHVKVEHVNEALRLMRVATYSALVNPLTGKIDFEQLAAGVSEGGRMRRSRLEEVLLTVLNDRQNVRGIDRAVLAEKASLVLRESNELPVDADGRELVTILRELEELGKLTTVAGGKRILTCVAAA